MFGLGITEIVVILVVALLFIGPDKLPEVAKSLGKGLRELRKVTDDVRDTVNGTVQDAVRNVTAKPVPPVTPEPPPVATAPPPEPAPPLPGSGLTTEPVSPDAVLAQKILDPNATEELAPEAREHAPDVKPADGERVRADVKDIVG